MKFTNSKDGKPRATISVRHRVGRAELVLAAAFDLYSVTDLIDTSGYTRKQVEDVLRKRLYNKGEEFVVFEEDADEEPEWIRARNAAEELIARLYPELGPATPPEAFCRVS